MFNDEEMKILITGTGAMKILNLLLALPSLSLEQRCDMHKVAGDFMKDHQLPRLEDRPKPGVYITRPFSRRGLLALAMLVAGMGTCFLALGIAKNDYAGLQEAQALFALAIGGILMFAAVVVRGI